MFGGSGSRTLERLIQDPKWNRWASGATLEDQKVNAHTATQLLTVYGCVTRIADVMATMPVRHLTNAGETGEVSQRAAWLDQPNPDSSWESFVVQMVWSLFIDGNAFLSPIRNNMGRVVEIWVLDPQRVVLIRQKPGAPTVVLLDGKPFGGELLHIPLYVRPGDIRGINPIDNARTALGWGMAAEAYGKGFLENAAVPPLLLNFKQPINPEQRDQVREGWNAKHQGKPGGVGIVSGDVTATLLAIPPEQAQFLQTQNFSAAQIASNMFHVPPNMVGAAVQGQQLYQNIESNWIEFIRSACQPVMIRIERAISWNLLPRPQYIRFNPDDYLRADTLTRYQTARMGVEATVKLPNEWRKDEGLPPIPGGDEFPEGIKPKTLIV